MIEITKDVKIKENPNTNGYCCEFYIGDKKFYADVSYTMTCGPECMIFKYNENDTIDWSGVYADRDVTVSKESLMECIIEFAEEECGL